MSAQRSIQQTRPREQEKRQQTGLARRGTDLSAVLPSLLLDPLSFLSDDPFSLVRRMQRDMNRVFAQAGIDVSGQGHDISETTWTPATEIAYQNGNLIVSAELPGLSEKDVTVEINGDFLVIRGERRIEQEQQEGGIRRTERRYGEFYRAIALPDGADTENARAEFQNGVLRVIIPVSQAESEVRQIPVQATSASSRGEQQATSTSSQGEQQQQSSTHETQGEQKAA